MMKAIGIILAGGNNKRMKELSYNRAIAAMPMVGTYRSIDFALSNMSNSRIQKVAVLTQYNTVSLNEHLNSSKWWDFGRKQGGLYVFTPTITAENSNWYRGTADALYQNLHFLKGPHPRAVRRRIGGIGSIRNHPETIPSGGLNHTPKHGLLAKIAAIFRILTNLRVLKHL